MNPDVKRSVQTLILIRESKQKLRNIFESAEPMPRAEEEAYRKASIEELTSEISALTIAITLLQRP